MGANLLSLVLLLSFSGVVLSSCNGMFDVECYYDMIFGDYDSSEEDSSAENKVIGNLTEQVSNLSSIIQNHISKDSPNDSASKESESKFINNTVEKLNEILRIVSHLENLNKAEPLPSNVPSNQESHSAEKTAENTTKAESKEASAEASAPSETSAADGH